MSETKLPWFRVLYLPAGGRIMTIEDYEDELDWLGEWGGRRG